MAVGPDLLDAVARRDVLRRDPFAAKAATRCLPAVAVRGNREAARWPPLDHEGEAVEVRADSQPVPLRNWPGRQSC
eukprot:9592094-Lingulodinium_polyedra.AAC.1